MPTLIITIEEKTEETEGGVMVGYGIYTKAEPEDCEDSILPYVAPLLRDMIGKFLSEAHMLNGADHAKTSVADNSISLESLMAEWVIKHNQPFPSEL